MNESKYFYKGQEVTLMYTTNDNESWIRLENGIDLIVPFDEINTRSKFEHLRDLPVDTKVLVKESIDEKWTRRHFSHVSDDGNKVFCFTAGMTSFTSCISVTAWLFCEVYNERIKQNEQF